MIDDSDDKTSPARPSATGWSRYEILRETEKPKTAQTTGFIEITEPPPPQDYARAFNLNIAGYVKKGGYMNPEDERLVLDNRFITDLVFKSDYSGLRLTPNLSQLLLAKIGEILEKGQIAEDEQPETEREDITCK